MNPCPYCGSPTPPHATVCPSCGTMLSVALPPGTMLAGGRYRIGHTLGQGGFGITYQGEDTLLARRVAIKELFPDGSLRSGKSLVPAGTLGPNGLAQARTRFLEEARALARFNHPGIVQVIDVLEEHQTAYLVMEFVEGETLGARLDREGALEPAAVLILAHKIIDALEVVHRAGLLHRDLKPDNIFLSLPVDGNERVVLIDFGSARGFEAGQASAHTRLVTPGYAPLEQYAATARFGPATDLYALAATLYHALTGTPPPAATDRVLGSPLIDLHSVAGGLVPLGLRTAIERSLAQHLGERPQSSDEFRAFLNTALNTALNASPATPQSTPMQPQAPATTSSSRAQMDLGPSLETERTESVSSLDWDPNGEYLISSSGDRSVKLWRIETQNPKTLEFVRPLGFHFARIERVRSAGPDAILTASEDKTAELRTLEDRKLQTFTHQNSVLDAQISRDGQLVASVDRGRNVRIFERNGREVALLSGLGEAAFAWCDARRLATTTWGGDIKLWEASSGRALRTFGEGINAHSLTWNPDGSRLAALGPAGVWVFDPQGQLIFNYNFKYDHPAQPGGKRDEPRTPGELAYSRNTLVVARGSLLLGLDETGGLRWTLQLNTLIKAIAASGRDQLAIATDTSLSIWRI